MFNSQNVCLFNNLWVFLELGPDGMVKARFVLGRSQTGFVQWQDFQLDFAVLDCTHDNNKIILLMKEKHILSVILNLPWQQILEKTLLG